MENQQVNKASRPVKYDYAVKILSENLRKEEENIKFWNDIISNPNSDPLALRQAKGSISSTEQRAEELKKVIAILAPPPSTSTPQA